MPKKVITPAGVVALRQALTDVYWYKADLRSFLTSVVNDRSLLSAINWSDYKRNIVDALVAQMQADPERHQSDLLRLMSEVARIEDFSHLAKLENGKAKATAAKASVSALKTLLVPHEELTDEHRRSEERRKRAYEQLVRTTAVQERLQALSKDYFELLVSTEPKKRGFQLEKIIRHLFEIFDLDPKASFRITGEQIDGAFTFDSTDYLFEAKWEQRQTSAHDLDGLAGKLSRKLDNTLGLFLSVNGFSEDGVKAHSSGRRTMILMDGSDLMAVLEGRIDLVQLLLRKRRHAAQTGNIYLRLHEIL